MCENASPRLIFRPFSSLEKGLAEFPPVQASSFRFGKWDPEIIAIFNRIRIKNVCQEKKRGLDLATAYLVVVTRQVLPGGFPDKPVQQSVASSFKFYQDLDSAGVIEKVGIRDKHRVAKRNSGRTSTLPKFRRLVSATRST